MGIPEKDWVKELEDRVFMDGEHQEPGGVTAIE